MEPIDAADTWYQPCLRYQPLYDPRSTVSPFILGHIGEDQKLVLACFQSQIKRNLG